MIISHDLLWKYLIEGRFAEFLRFFFAQYEDGIDFARGFEFLDKELRQLYPESASSKRSVDKLVKIWLKNGQEKWVLIHIEVQGWHDVEFPHRMFQYHYRILDRYGVEVTSIAILTDDSKSWKPDRYEFRFMGTSHVFRFNVYKLATKSRLKLFRSGNPFGFMLAAAFDSMKNAPDEQKLWAKIGLVKRLLRQGYVRQDMRDLLIFIRNYWRFDNISFYRTFDDEIDLLTNNVEPMNLVEAVNKAHFDHGLEKGQQIGLEKGVEITTRQHIRNMLLRGFSPTDIADILQVSSRFVDEVVRSMFNEQEITVTALLANGYSMLELHSLLEVGLDALEILREKGL